MIASPPHLLLLFQHHVLKRQQLGQHNNYTEKLTLLNFAAFLHIKIELLFKVTWGTTVCCCKLLCKIEPLSSLIST